MNPALNHYTFNAFKNCDTLKNRYALFFVAHFALALWLILAGGAFVCVGDLLSATSAFKQMETPQNLATSRNTVRLVEYGRRAPDGMFFAARTAPDARAKAIAPIVTRGIYLKTKQRIVADNVADNVAHDGAMFLHPAIETLCRRYETHSATEIASFAGKTAETPAVVTRILFVGDIDARKLCEELEELDAVEYAEPMQILSPRQSINPALVSSPNDPLFARQYHWRQIQAEAAWALTANKGERVIAVCDTGVDWEHEDLADNIWNNPGETGVDALGRDKRTNGVDDDGNGKIDDWRGWDFVGDASESELLRGAFREDNDPKPRFRGGLVPLEMPNHGTHVAGTAAAIAHNGRGGVGAAFQCKILPIKCSTDGARIDGIFRAYEAVLYAAQTGARVIVCSFGGGRYNRFEQDVINAATAMGALVVVAAGNDGKLADNADYPASYDNVLAVGASAVNGRASATSDFGLMVDVFAPGERILSAAVGNEYTDAFSGTSMATPIVAGIAALVSVVRPDWSPAQIARQIRASSDNVLLGDAPPQNRSFGFFGRVNAFNAVSAMQTPGVQLRAIKLQAANGVIHDARPTLVRLAVENILAPARNVRVALVSLDRRAVALTQEQTIGDLPAGGAREIDFLIQLEPSAFQGSGVRTADFVLVALAADSHIHYERISIPYNLRPSLNADALVGAALQFGVSSSSALQIPVLNSGRTPLLLKSVEISGANAADFSAALPPDARLGAGEQTFLTARFTPQFGATQRREALLTLKAEPFDAPPLGAIAGGYVFEAQRLARLEPSDGTPIIGGGGEADDEAFEVPIGFRFPFGGENFDRIVVSSNGFCAFAPRESLTREGAVVTRPLSAGAPAKGYISALGGDLILRGGARSSDVRVRLEGATPNRIFTVEWRNAELKATPGSRFNARVRLLEASAQIEIVFGECALPVSAGTLPLEVGLRGESADDIHSRRVSLDVDALWASSVEANAPEEACEVSASSLPENGLRYVWKPLAEPRSRSLAILARHTRLFGEIAAPLATSVGFTNLENENLAATKTPSLQWNIHPNPANDEFVVELGANVAEASVRIANALGVMIFSHSFGMATPRATEQESERRLRIQTGAWSQGVYFVTVAAAGGQTGHRALVIRR
jgi:hypothetical protein